MSYLPNLIIAGVTKAGTTSLFHGLGQHPDICPSKVKEVNHFSGLRRGGRSVPPPSSYRAFFDHCAGERYRLEASPLYCTGGEELIEALQADLGSPKVLLALREPADRLWSEYCFLKSLGRVPGATTYREYVQSCREGKPVGARVAGPQPFTPLSIGFYDRWLPSWLHALGPDLRVVFFDDLAQDAARTYEELARWLGLRDFGNLVPPRRNVTGEARSARLAQLGEAGRYVSNRLFRRAPGIRDNLRNLYAALNVRERREERDVGLDEELRDTYRESCAETGRQLQQGGYQRLPRWLSPRELSTEKGRWEGV